MMAEAGCVDAPAPTRRWSRAVLIALVYALLGPPVGALLILPIAMIATLQFSTRDIPGTAAAMLFVIPLGLIFSYVMAGAIALVTGVATAAVAFRRGVVPIGTAFVVAMLVFGVFLILQQILHGSIPGASLLRGEGRVGPGLGAVISLAASLICWRLTRHLQRQLA